MAARVNLHFIQYENGAVVLIASTYPKIIEKTVNLGDLPYFERKNSQPNDRIARYHHNNWIEKFSRLVSLTRIADTLEINL